MSASCVCAIHVSNRIFANTSITLGLRITYHESPKTEPATRWAVGSGRLLCPDYFIGLFIYFSESYITYILCRRNSYQICLRVQTSHTINYFESRVCMPSSHIYTLLMYDNVSIVVSSVTKQQVALCLVVRLISTTITGIFAFQTNYNYN